MLRSNATREDAIGGEASFRDVDLLGGMLARQTGRVVEGCLRSLGSFSSGVNPHPHAPTPYLLER